MFTNEQKSVYFLEYHLENSFKKIANEFLLNNVEWHEGDEVRPIGELQDSNIVLLFPPFDDRDMYYLPEDNS